MHLQKNRGNIENFNWGGAVPWERQRSPWDMFGGGFGGYPGGFRQFNPEMMDLIQSGNVVYHTATPAQTMLDQYRGPGYVDDGQKWAANSRTYGGPSRIPQWMQNRAFG